MAVGTFPSYFNCKVNNVKKKDFQINSIRLLWIFIIIDSGLLLFLTQPYCLGYEERKRKVTVSLSLCVSPSCRRLFAASCWSFLEVWRIQSSCSSSSLWESWPSSRACWAPMVRLVWEWASVSSSQTAFLLLFGLIDSRCVSGEEVGMLEDMEVGVADLRSLAFSVTEAKSEQPEDLQPTLRGTWWEHTPTHPHTHTERRHQPAVFSSIQGRFYRRGTASLGNLQAASSGTKGGSLDPSRACSV